jgi:hypothetical protein
MQRDAAKASVALPPKDASGQTYSFSFAAQRDRLAYAAGSLEPLAIQLSEIKAICAVLFQAKVNSLDELRRERVSEDDARGPQTDYLSDKSLTNELAVMSPYEVSFRCFSSELAAVLAGFASAPCGLMIKTINVESAPAMPATTDSLITPPMFTAPTPTYLPPPPRVVPRTPDAEMSPEAAFARRYGLGGGGGRRGEGAPPAPQRYVPPVATPAAPAAAAASRGGLPPALDEKQLKVTLALCAVKLLPTK